MNERNLDDELSAPFSPKLVKKRPGPSGKSLSYVPIAAYVSRLNASLGRDWSFEVLEVTVHEREVVVRARLSLATCRKDGIGAASIRESRGSDTQAVGEALKAASSDALKRCCRLLGLGLDLYTEESSGLSGVPIRHRVTRAQLDRLRSVASDLELDWRTFRDRVRQEHGVVPEFLDRHQADELALRLEAHAAKRGRTTAREREPRRTAWPR